MCAAVKMAIKKWLRRDPAAVADASAADDASSSTTTVAEPDARHAARLTLAQRGVIFVAARPDRSGAGDRRSPGSVQHHVRTIDAGELNQNWADFSSSSSFSSAEDRLGGRIQVGADYSSSAPVGHRTRVDDDTCSKMDVSTTKLFAGDDDSGWYMSEFGSFKCGGSAAEADPYDLDASNRCPAPVCCCDNCAGYACSVFSAAAVASRRLGLVPEEASSGGARRRESLSKRITADLKRGLSDCAVSSPGADGRESRDILRPDDPVVVVVETSPSRGFQSNAMVSLNATVVLIWSINLTK